MPANCFITGTTKDFNKYNSKANNSLCNNKNQQNIKCACAKSVHTCLT